MSAKQLRCLVFGGSGAIGSAVCRVLAREGARLALTYHTGKAAAEQLADELGACSIHQCDLSKMADVGAAVRCAAERLGGLDALIQAAGDVGDATFYQTAESGDYDNLQKITQVDFDTMMAVNVRGAFAACQHGSRYLREAGGGNIIAIGSIDGIKPVPSPIHFASANAALRGMVESMSKELGHHNICVNLIAPGILETGSSHVLSKALTASYLEHCSLRRFGKADEVAELAGWLALHNTYVTGQSIILDGGL